MEGLGDNFYDDEDSDCDATNASGKKAESIGNEGWSYRLGHLLRHRLNWAEEAEHACIADCTPGEEKHPTQCDADKQKRTNNN